jgi:acyl-CoA synthetase (AMP-forming)/AMP-acid ligase II
VAFGVADEGFAGQRIAVAVVAPGADESTTVDRIIQQCRTLLPSYMVPSEIRFMDALPLGSTGKPDRRRLADEPAPSSAVLR